MVVALVLVRVVAGVGSGAVAHDTTLEVATSVNEVVSEGLGSCGWGSVLGVRAVAG